jgi:broad specificity phosphatase PhoE
MASRIMIIRHGEKPSDDGSIHGVDQHGSHDPTELSVRGWQRAGALVRLFAPLNGAISNQALATPEHIFACGPKDHAPSVRSVHTVQTLAEFLNRSVDQSMQKGDEKKLAKAAISAQGPVLIAWEHDVIPDIVAAISGEDQLCPRKWPDSRFDVVWVLDKNGSGWSFSQAAQMALPGDRAEVIEFVKGGKP